MAVRIRPDREVAVAEQVARQERVVVGHHVDQEHREGDARHQRLDDDLDRIEPVELLAAVEHELEAADGDGEQDEAQHVERPPPVVRGVAHQNQDAGSAQEADRQVDVEHPAPGELVGQPAAERRADDRADHGADAPHRHRLALLLARIGVHHDGL